MRICQVPDANMRFLRGALERLTNLCDPEASPPDSCRTLADALRASRQTVDDILAGNPHADVHSRHRANRACLERMCEDLTWIKNELVTAEDEMIYHDDQRFFYEENCDLLGFDLDTAIEHVSNYALDKWEVEE